MPLALAPLPASRRAFVLRPARADDAAAMQAFVNGLCATSRRQRFHAALSACPSAWARKLVERDGLRQEVWIALDVQAHRVIAEARWVRGAALQRDAELALAVADAWRGSGLADALMQRLLASAGAAGVSRLLADVLPDNRRMLRLLQRHGFAPGAGDGQCTRLLRDVDAMAVAA